MRIDSKQHSLECMPRKPSIKWVEPRRPETAERLHLRARIAGEPGVVFEHQQGAAAVAACGPKRPGSSDGYE